MRHIALIAALLIPYAPAVAQVRAVDGDTLTIGTERIRLFGIDAPEAKQTCRIGGTDWTCGLDAAEALRSMVDDKQVTCQPLDKDVYGRTVSRCYAGGKDIAAELVQAGLAVVIDRGTALYGRLEVESKAYRAGVWASEFEMPAVYRNAHMDGPLGATQPRRTAVARRQVAQPQVAGSPFRSCAAARAVGAAPMYRGQAGYNPKLDGDNDGIACEPYRGRR